MARSVGFVPSTMVIVKVLLGQLRSPGRLIGLGLLGLLSMVISWSVGSGADPIESVHLDNAAGVITLFTFSLVMPVIALIFGVGALGDARDDGTLVYLWLRPLNQASVALGAWLAATAISLPLVVIPATLSALLLDAGSELVTATLIASTLAVIAYVAVFVMLGLLTRFAVVLGLVYVLLWEGVVASLGSIGAKMALRGYANSIVTARTGVRTELANSAESTSIIVFAVVTIVALIVSVVRLQALEVD
ncbi:MAG: hypothetical protein AAF548_09395 [Actinomycetota bacterium]